LGGELTHERERRGGWSRGEADATAGRHGAESERGGRRPWGNKGEIKGIPESVVARGIDKRGADGGGFRRRSSAARKEGKWRRSTRARFRAAGAPPGPRKCIPNLGWSGGTLREADNERRPPGQSKMAGEPTASSGGGRGGASLLLEGYSHYCPELRRGEGARRENGRCTTEPRRAL
jgi:hypothetical protein